MPVNVDLQLTLLNSGNIAYINLFQTKPWQTSLYSLAIVARWTASREQQAVLRCMFSPPLSWGKKYRTEFQTLSACVDLTLLHKGDRTFFFCSPGDTKERLLCIFLRNLFLMVCSHFEVNVSQRQNDPKWGPAVSRAANKLRQPVSNFTRSERTRAVVPTVQSFKSKKQIKSQGGYDVLRGSDPSFIALWKKKEQGLGSSGVVPWVERSLLMKPYFLPHPTSAPNAPCKAVPGSSLSPGVAFQEAFGAAEEFFCPWKCSMDPSHCTEWTVRWWMNLPVVLLSS